MTVDYAIIKIAGWSVYACLEQRTSGRLDLYHQNSLIAALGFVHAPAAMLREHKPLGGLQIQVVQEESLFEYIHHVAYVVNDMDDALRVFLNTFELELSDRRVIEWETTVEMAAFRYGLTLIEVLRPINHPALAQFLEEHGPNLHHIGFAMKDLPKRVEELKEKGVVTGQA